MASILTWKEQYFSEGYEQLLSQDESWWDGLYDYERDLAEFLVSIAPDISEQVYLGQDPGAVSGDSGYWGECG